MATANTQPSNPVITELLDGRFMVAWTEFTYNPESFQQYSHVKGRVISADGIATDAPFNIDSEGAWIPSNPTIDTLLDGRVAVSYTVKAGVLGRPDLLTQILDPRRAAIDIDGSDGGDRLLGTRFADTMAGGLGNDRINGGNGMDRLFGNAGTDVLKGGSGDDLLRGGNGDDTLWGGSGRDTLNGDKGANIFTGGGGNDTFVFHARPCADTVTDFEIGQDRLNLRALDFFDANAALAAFSQTENGASFTLGDTSILLTGIDVADLTGSALLI